MKASIIIPCYNAEKWINECVMSALNQTHEDIEVIAVDNESTDSTVAMLEELQKMHPNLKLDSAPNIYPNCWDEARGKGFELSTGQYLFTLAADDVLDKDYVSNCLKFILSAPDRIFAFQSPIRNINDFGVTLQNMADMSHSYSSLGEFKSATMEKCPANSPTVVFNRKLFDDGLLATHPEKYGGAADYDLYCRLADKEVFIWPGNRWTGYYYRWHEGQATWNVIKEPTNYDKMIQDYWREKWNL